MEEKACLYALSCSGISPRNLKNFLGHFQSAARLWELPETVLNEAEEIPKAQREKFAAFRRTFPLKKAWNNFLLSKISVVGFHEKEYPERLKAIPDPPPLLFYRGSLSSMQKLALAIVGSRNASPQGKFKAKTLASSLADAGFVVVSGLARGIDMAAHLGALDGGGETLAVLGSGVDRIYPYENENLAKRIEKSGAIISEFPPGTEPRSWNFPQRNRIISGLALGVVVVEAWQKSGALITARFAMEQGREVFAVPGNPENPLSRGTNALIQDGAKLVQGMGDILDEFPYIHVCERPIQSSSVPENMILTALENQKEGKIIEQIIQETKLPVQGILGHLFVLQSKGLVSRLPGNIYVRA